jgi:hypothetical protein
METVDEQPSKGKFSIDEFRSDPIYPKMLRDVENLEADLAKPRVDTHEICFGIGYETKFGEKIFAIGSTDFCGEWDLAAALKLKWTEGNIWRATVEVKGDLQPFEYKYVCVSSDSNRWEPGANRVLDLSTVTSPAKGNYVYNLESKWQRRN